jgi:HK97 family phage prohead protease
MPGLGRGPAGEGDKPGPCADTVRPPVQGEMKTNHSAPETNPDSLLQADFPDRLVTLCDGRSGLRGGLRIEARLPEPNPEAHTDPIATPVPEPAIIDFVASDETLDRYDEIISASGWRVDAYRRNPVFQNAHQYGDIVFTLGKALVTEIRQGRLFQRVEFAVDANPIARIAYRLYRGKFLNAVSVGFIPLRWETGGEGAGFKRRFLEQELLEVSAVGIPANPNALQLALKAGAIQAADLRETLEILRQLCGNRPCRSTAAPASSAYSLSSPNGSASQPGLEPGTAASALWLGLARQIRDVLRGS